MADTFSLINAQMHNTLFPIFTNLFRPGYPLIARIRMAGPSVNLQRIRRRKLRRTKRRNLCKSMDPVKNQQHGQASVLHQVSILMFKLRKRDGKKREPYLHGERYFFLTILQAVQRRFLKLVAMPEVVLHN
jgi:hypothetical protein